MSSSDERVEALAEGIWNAMPAHHVGWRGLVEKDFYRRIAQDLLDSPAMRDLLANERANALREAAEDAERMEAVGKTRADRIDETTREHFSRHPLRELTGIQPHRLTVAAWLRGLADGEVDR